MIQNTIRLPPPPESWETRKKHIRKVIITVLTIIFLLSLLYSMIYIEVDISEMSNEEIEYIKGIFFEYDLSELELISYCTTKQILYKPYIYTRVEFKVSEIYYLKNHDRYYLTDNNGDRIISELFSHSNYDVSTIEKKGSVGMYYARISKFVPFFPVIYGLIAYVILCTLILFLLKRKNRGSKDEKNS